MSPKSCRSPQNLALLLLTNILLFFSGLAFAIPQLAPLKRPQQPPPQESEVAYMFGYKNPIRLTPGNTNALVLVQPIGYGAYAQTALVRSLVSGPNGLPGCEGACIRKTGSLREITNGVHIQGFRKMEIYQTAKNEIEQHYKIQNLFEQSGTRNVFFPRALAHKEHAWPPDWMGDPIPTVSVELYQDFIQGWTLRNVLLNHIMAKEDAWSIGVQYMKGVFSAVKAMRQWDPPIRHNDIHWDNVIIGWLHDQAPVPTKARLGTRPFLIDFGVATEMNRVGSSVQDDQDILKMRDSIEALIRYTGTDPAKVMKGWLKKFLFRSPAERAIRKAYFLLRGIPSNHGPGETQLRPSIDANRIYASLEKIYTGVPETYSVPFQRWMTTPPVNKHAEPLRYSSPEQLIEAGRTLKVAGPWYVTKVQRRGTQWVVQQMYDEKQCDWSDCVNI